MYISEITKKKQNNKKRITLKSPFLFFSIPFCREHHHPEDRHWP